MEPLKLPRRKPSRLLRQWWTFKRFLRAARKRWRLESPAFFVRLKRYSVALGTVAGSMALGSKANEAYGLLPVELLPWVETATGYIAAAAYGMAIASQLAALNPPDDGKP